MTRKEKQRLVYGLIVVTGFIILGMVLYGVNQGWFTESKTPTLTGEGEAVTLEEFQYDFVSSSVSLGDEGDIFIQDHKNVAGAHTYQTETHTYVLLSTGEENKDKTLAFIDAELQPDQTVTLDYSLIPAEEKEEVSNMLVRFNSGAITEVDVTLIPESELDAFLAEKTEE